MFFVKKCQNNLLIAHSLQQNFCEQKTWEHEFGKIYFMLKNYDILDLPALQIAP